MDKFEILERLISYNTIKDLENLKLMDFVKEYLEEFGFKTIELYDYKKNKKCLIATYGENPNLAFIGHTDTVGYTNWEYDPFKLTIENGNLYGLGTCDMKGGIAAFLSAITKIDLKKLKRGIQVVLTYDEEIGFDGIKLIQNKQDILANNIIVGEPTDLVPVIATKGCVEYKFEFTGKSAHSSEPQKGDNAILKCYACLTELLEFYEQLKQNTNSIFEIPYTTMNVAKIEGGNSINIIPEECTLYFDFRTVFKTQNEEIKEKIKYLKDKYQIKVTEITNIPPLENDGEEIEFYEALTGKKISYFNYVTEASFIKKKNVIILGPGPNTAHQKDEYITLESFNLTIEKYKEIIERYCSEKSN